MKRCSLPAHRIHPPSHLAQGGPPHIAQLVDEVGELAEDAQTLGDILMMADRNDGLTQICGKQYRVLTLPGNAEPREDGQSLDDVYSSHSHGRHPRCALVVMPQRPAGNARGLEAQLGHRPEHVIAARTMRWCHGARDAHAGAVFQPRNTA